MILRIQNRVLALGPVQAGDVESEGATGKNLPHEMHCASSQQWHQPNFCFCLWSAFIQQGRECSDAY